MPLAGIVAEDVDQQAPPDATDDSPLDDAVHAFRSDCTICTLCFYVKMDSIEPLPSLSTMLKWEGPFILGTDDSPLDNAVHAVRPDCTIRTPLHFERLKGYGLFHPKVP